MPQVSLVSVRLLHMEIIKEQSKEDEFLKQFTINTVM